MAATDIVLLAKDDWWCRNAAELARIAFGERLIVHQGSAEDPLPVMPACRHLTLLSFRSPWVVPESILEQCELAINFHPGSHEYPGYGCYSFALYEEAREYGCVCHHMAEIVDTGALIAEQRFKMAGYETVEMLKLRTYTVMLSLFQDITFRIARSEALPRLEVNWSRRPFTHRQHQQLSTITPDMSAKEVKRRVHATTYPGEGAILTMGGIVFRAAVPTRPPLA